MTRPQIIAMWAVPRSRSTAFLRMIIERGDLDVVHEPFSNLAATGRFELGEHTATSVEELFELLLERASTGGRRLFVKETTDYRYDALLADPRLHTELTNTFMIREPAAVVGSHYAMNRDVTRDEIGFERVYEIFSAVRAAGAPAVVVDGDELVADPPAVIVRYCELTGLPFLPEALTWDRGERPEWARTEAWHRDVSRSSGFSTGSNEHPIDPADAERVAALVAYHRPFYERLHEQRIAAAAV
ncbi:hypothetical protein AB0M46_37190 [Dactylosporangium sp. NPDC051485]|uniref:sulfotransferase-like domain-containing protein n=1 Tax=Dactylosporangium sp. NPDC051485 TaxID=3154846 RepID=UPI00343DE71A